jgi:hypothetical protein
MIHVLRTREERRQERRPVPLFTVRLRGDVWGNKWTPGTFWFLLAWKSYDDFLPGQHCMFWREGTLAPLSLTTVILLYVLIEKRDSSGSQTGDPGHDDTGIVFRVVRF